MSTVKWEEFTHSQGGITALFEAARLEALKEEAPVITVKDEDQRKLIADWLQRCHPEDEIDVRCDV